MHQLFPNELTRTGEVRTMTSCDADASCRKVLNSLNTVAYLCFAGRLH